jgi:hypothetical protein
MMEANGLEADWREVALLLNGANEVLAQEIHQLNQECARLQAEYKKMQGLRLIINKGRGQNN